MNRKDPIVILLCFLVLCIVSIGPGVKAEAASDYNLIESVSAKHTKSGVWKKNNKGWWYEYYNGKYPKNQWLKIGNDLYFFNKKGYMVTGKKAYKGNLYFLKASRKAEGALYSGWKRMKGKQYYFSPETGSAVTGWQEIEGEKHHFSEKGVMSKSCTVDGIKLDEKGMQVIGSGNDASISTAPNPGISTESQIIFVGDSRTVGLKQTVGGNAQYIGKVGEGYSWLTKSAVKKLDKQLEKYPASKVILNFGINDLGNITKYILYYQNLFTNYPQASFYIASIHPIEQKLAKCRGYALKNKQIEAFNAQMRTAFPNNFIDTYSYLTSQNYIASKGKSTADGIHYTPMGYQTIYSYIMSQIL